MPVHEGQLEPSDKHLLDRAKTQWQFGDWASLAALSLDRLAHHPQRSQLALLAAAGQAQCGALEDANASVQQASEWGASRQQVARVLVSGVYNALGKAAAVAGQSERALPLFRSALAVAGPEHEVRLLTGVRTRQQLGQLGFVNTAVMSEWPQEACLPSSHSSPSSNQEILKSKIKKVGELRAENDFETAEALLREILGEQPNNAVALKELGKLRSVQERWQEAHEVYGQLLCNQKGAIQAILSRANAQRDAERLDQAIAELEHAKALGFNTAAVSHQLAIAYRDNRQWAEADHQIREVVRLDPGYSKQLQFATFAADVLRKCKSPRDAFKLLQAAVDYASAQNQEISLNAKAILIELRRADDEGDESTEVSKRFYDTIYAQSEKYRDAPEHSVYLPVWKKVLDELRPHAVRSVVDIGCGPGQFAQYLLQNMPELDYRGFDYSRTAILQAKQRCPSAQFFERDVMKPPFLAEVKADAFIILEVLEHVEFDLELLTKICAGQYVILSVPSFDSFGHVRFFKDADDVLSRYGKLFDDLRLHTITLAKRSRIYVATGCRKKPEHNHTFE